MNPVVSLMAFFGAAAYLLARRRGGKPWVYVAASVPISIAVYFAVIIGVALTAN